MVNEMLAAGMLLLGTVDTTSAEVVTVEYVLNNSIKTIVIPKETSLCDAQEGMKVLFYRDAIVECFLKSE